MSDGIRVSLVNDNPGYAGVVSFDERVALQQLADAIQNAARAGR
jgi:hypothetical protein